jgi:hypothetical protein
MFWPHMAIFRHSSLTKIVALPLQFSRIWNALLLPPKSIKFWYLMIAQTEPVIHQFLAHNFVELVNVVIYE